LEKPSRPYTVVQVTTSENQSGGTRQALMLCRALHERGHRLVFGGVEGSPALRWAQGIGLETLPLAYERLRDQWETARRLRRLARDVKADVVHAHHTHGHNLALMATIGGRFPPVVTNRGVVYPPSFTAKFRSRRTAAVITNSQAARRVLVDAGVSGDKVHVVYNAKEAPDLEAIVRRAPELRAELGLPQGAVVVGAVGNGKPEKGFQHLLAAAPSILERVPSAFFVLVGGGREPLRPQVTALGLEDRVLLTGPRPDVLDLMGLFDVFVLASLAESCPNVLLEAQGVGVPAVCSNVGGVPEILEDGRLGRLVPAADPPALAAAVLATLADPAGARATAKEGRREFAERFSVARKVEGTLAVYRKVLGKRGRT